MNSARNFKYFIALFLLCSTLMNVNAQSNKFKVVLDAGHGGKDFGAVYNGHVEKNIALGVVLKVQKYLEKYPSVNAVLTRNSDFFVELDERANIANREDANIFISVHCNANPSPAGEGFETYVMGVARNASNLEVAKKENGVITLEKDYKQNYEGYNPNSPESFIGIMMQQEEYIENSIALASKIQDNFNANGTRKNRGVRQAGFLVLRKIAMPRILIEMGFISNPAEGNYLDSEQGQQEVSESIAKAILSYKKEYFDGGNNDIVVEKPKAKNLKAVDSPSVKKETIVKVSEDKKVKETKKQAEKENVKVQAEPIKTENESVVFKIQISAGNKKLELKPKNFKGLDNISMEVDGNLYKYMYGETGDYDEAKKNLKTAKSKGYGSAYIVAIRNGEKISLKEATRKL